MAELLNHKHCKNCERAIPSDEELCSEECRTAWAAFQKKRQRTVLLFYGGSALLLVLLLLQFTGYFSR